MTSNHPYPSPGTGSRLAFLRPPDIPGLYATNAQSQTIEQGPFAPGKRSLSRRWRVRLTGPNTGGTLSKARLGCQLHTVTPPTINIESVAKHTKCSFRARRSRRVSRRSAGTIRRGGRALRRAQPKQRKTLRQTARYLRPGEWPGLKGAFRDAESRLNGTLALQHVLPGGFRATFLRRGQ